MGKNSVGQCETTAEVNTESFTNLQWNGGLQSFKATHLKDA